MTVERFAQLYRENSFREELNNLISKDHLPERLQQIEFVTKIERYGRLLNLLSQLEVSHLKITATPALKKLWEAVDTEVWKVSSVVTIIKCSLKFIGTINLVNLHKLSVFF